jgi:tetratricopeptide (TPR) repeat protein
LSKPHKRIYPKRDQNATLERESEIYYTSRMPVEWIVDELSDYGIDLVVTPVFGENVIGLNYSVQLKAQNDVKGKWEVRLKKTTLNYLFTRLEPVMVVLFDKKSQEARWKWLLSHDFDLTKEVDSYAVKFNDEQIFSRIDWNSIASFVQRVFKVKNQLLTSLEYDLFNTHSEVEIKAWSHYFSKNTDEASFYFKRLVLQPNPRDIWFVALSQCQYAMYDYRNALININKALELNTDDTILLTKGCILAEDGIRGSDYYKLAEAEKIFSDLFARVPNAVHAYNYANTIAKFNKLDDAVKLYKIALEEDPNYAEAWKNLGQVYYDLKMHKEELACYEKALTINPNLLQATISKAITNGYVYHKYKNSLATILATIEKKSDIFSEFPLIYYWIGYFYFKIKNTGEGLNWINKGLANDPGDWRLLNLKANIFIESVNKEGNYLDDAISFFAEHYNRNPNDTGNFYYLCNSIASSGNIEKAYDMSISWLKSQTCTTAFENANKDLLPFEKALQVVKYWDLVKSYLTQYPLEQLRFSFENSGITKIDEFMQCFEIARIYFLIDIAEIIKKSTNKKKLKNQISLSYKNHFHGLPEEPVCNMIAITKSDLQEFAKQFSEVVLLVCNLFLVELSRTVGFTAGHMIDSHEKGWVVEIVDESMFRETLLFYTELFYRHFNLGNTESPESKG